MGVAKEEEEITSQRRKDLKAMYVDLFFFFVKVLGVSGVKREDLISGILKNEAKTRAEKREEEATVRGFVVEKKEELEAQSASDLKKLCAAQGIEGSSKSQRVEQLLAKWVQDDGISKARAKAAYDAREAELSAMDKQALQKICTKEKLDPYVKDVMIERLIQRENELGNFSVPKKEEDEVPTTSTTKGSVVDALLAKTKQEEEMVKKKQEEADRLAKKVKEFLTKSQDELKKLISRKGLEASGKEKMIEALVLAEAQEEAVNARKAEVKAMGKEELAEILKSKGLKIDKSKDTMGKTLLEHEANLREQLEAFDRKMCEISAKKQEELELKTNSELKDMCIAKGLPAGVAKEDRAKRLVEAARKEGELDKVYIKTIRNARTEVLKAMEDPALLKLCNEIEVDPFVKEIMVGRILSHEVEIG